MEEERETEREMELAGDAEAAVSRAIGKLSSLLTEKANLLDVEALRVELELVRAFLKDAEAIAESDEALKIWVKQAKEVAELMEDVVDNHVLKASQQGFGSFLGRVGGLIGKLNSRRDLNSNLHNIKDLLVDVQRTGRRYNLSRMDVLRRRNRRHRIPFMDYQFYDRTVGIDSKVRDLVWRLTNGEESARSVISLVGVGGIGKTVLALEVLRDRAVKQHFDCCVWITVSQTYSLGILLNNLMTQIGEERIITNDTSKLMRAVRERLRMKKRYILAFDDVWEESFWTEMQQALPDDGNGSRIIITTRSDSVAACCSATSADHIERPEPLSMDMSLCLFSSIVFPVEDYKNVQRFESLCHEFLRLCGGLPLAIVVVAGALIGKTVEEWDELLHNFHSELNSDGSLKVVYSTFNLSFQDLPYYLKMCFLYFSIFPENSLISNDKLIKLWIAEDLIPEKRGVTLEQVAEEYLNKLISKNMVQACEGFYGSEKFCRVHSLMHNMVRQKADDFSFCRIRDARSSRFGGRSRRLSISNVGAENVLETIGDSQVRSVFLSNIDTPNSSFVIALFRKCKLLTLLDFEYVQIDSLPDEVGNLFHLKYLSLKNTKVKRLPKSVGKLQKLQTLDVRNTLLVELPIQISKLQNLRHLLASSYENEINLDLAQGVRINEGIGSLKELQTLTTVEAHISGMDVVQELKTLRQLRRLSISRLTRELARALCACIEEMNHLESLSLQMKDDEVLDLESISTAPPYMNRLVLKGFLQSFPYWISSLSNLSVLCLSLSMFSDDPLQHLCHLPNLMSLWLYKAYDGEKLHFCCGDFPKLKLLVLREFQRLETVEIEEGALPRLEELRIGPSKRLPEVPSGIQYLGNLKVVSFYDMPNKFVCNMQPDGGSEYWKVESIPSVLFWYRIRGRDYVSYRLGESDLLDHLQGLVKDIGNTNQHDHQLSFSYGDDEEYASSRFSFTSNPWMSDDDIED